MEELTMKTTYTLVVKASSSKESLENAFKIWAQAQGIELEYLENGDQTNRDFFSTIRWHRADIMSVLEENGISKTVHNIEVVEEQGRNLRDRSVEFGNEVLSDIIRDLDFQEKFE